MKRFVASVFAAGMMLSAPLAQAATATFDTLPTTATANPLADVKVGRVSENVRGSRPKERSVWQETGTDVGVLYTDPTAVYTAVHSGSATYNVGYSKSVSFAWGSPDLYNSVEFLLNGVVVDSFALTKDTNIYPGQLKFTGVWTVISGISGGVFNSIRFASAQDSFEYANLNVAPVPLPAGGALLITALGGFIVARRRKANV